MSNYYCIWVKTGFENKFIEKIQPLFDSAPDEHNGKLHCIGKQMRLKSGKEYIDPLIPGYIFWETDFELVVPGTAKEVDGARRALIQLITKLLHISFKTSVISKRR